MKSAVKRQTQYPVVTASLKVDTSKVWLALLTVLPLIAAVIIHFSASYLELFYFEIFCLIAGFLFFLFTAVSWNRLDGARSQIDLKAKGLDIIDPNLVAIMPWDWLKKVEIRQRRFSLFPNYVYFKFTNGSDVLILWDDVKETIDSTTLVSCVRTWAPQAEVHGDAELAKSESLASYTELWLRDMNAERGEVRKRKGQLLEPETQLNNLYSITRVLSSGGQGTAYLAETLPSSEHLMMPSRVVIKEFILPDNNQGLKKASDGLNKVVGILKRIDNPNIVRLYDFFVEDMRGYLVIEYVDGLTLRQIVQKSGPMSCKEVAAVAIVLCRALKYLHEMSPPVVHGDVSPDNIMIDSSSVVKLMDFDASQELTKNKTNTVMGKHAYMSPEQFKGYIDQSSDIYALGGTLHYMLTGIEPEPLTESHPSGITAGVSKEMSAIVALATTLDPALRYQRLEQMERDLELL